MGFKKFNEGKIKFSLLPPLALEEAAKVLTYGANKYGRDNWKLCKDTRDYIDALYRHLNEYQKGILYDEESGNLHISHVLANALFLVHFEKLQEITLGGN